MPARSHGPIASLLLAAAVGCGGAARDELPVPEFHGIYAAVGSGLISIDAGRSTTEPKMLEVKVGGQKSVGDLLNGRGVTSVESRKLAQLPSAVRMIVFAEKSGLASAMMEASELKLEALAFVHESAIDSGWPQNVRQKETQDAWQPVAGAKVVGSDASALPVTIGLLTKPFPAHDDMVIVVPERDLSPGVYALRGFERQPFYFAVGSPGDGESGRCVDYSCTYAMFMAACEISRCGAGGTEGAPDDGKSPAAAAAPAAAAPAAAANDVSEAAVWSPSDEQTQGLGTACDRDRRAGDCVARFMREHGASREAVAFAQSVPEGGYLDSFEEHGAVDVATVFYPFKANDNGVSVLLNGVPRMIPVDERVDRIDLKRDPAFAALKRRFPNLMLWPGSSRFVRTELAADDGLRFVFSYVLLNGCHACDLGGHAEIAFDFDGRRRLTGTHLVRIVADAPPTGPAG
jgi:hypothetical protein